MKQMSLIAVFILFGTGANAYEIPTPLKDIKVEASVSENSNGLFTYRYSIANPRRNGAIWAIDIFLDQSSPDETTPPTTPLKQCDMFLTATSQNALNELLITAVGSAGPKNWFCSYGRLAGFSSGSYGWAAEDAPYLIKPGSSKDGFVLTSFGLPAIRDILVKPDMDVDQLPPEYDSNVQKTAELEERVRWLGKTIGPKVPPKTFVSADFLAYLASLKDQSIALGWISNPGLEKELNAIFSKASKKLGTCDQADLRKLIERLPLELVEHRKGVSQEARSLLLSNARYFISKLPKLTHAEREKCERNQKDWGHDRGHDVH